MKLLLLFLLLLGAVNSARILAIFPMPSKSHSIMQFAVLKLLAQRGHEVLVYSAQPPPSSVPNVTHVHIPISIMDQADQWTFEEFSELTQAGHFYGFGVEGLWEVGLEVSEETLKNKKIQELLRSNEKFDLLFIEPTTSQESLVVFGHKFQAPVINFQGFGTWNIINWVAGNDLAISYIPEILSFPYTDRMSFVERLQNFASSVITLSYYHLIYLPKQEKLIQKYYNNPDTPSITDMLSNISLTFSNTYKTIEYPRPYTPNIVSIGGAHMSSHMTPLPKDIKKFLDNAKDGAIFFSLGTLVPAHAIPDHYIQAFVKTFKKLKQRVLWKINLQNIPGLSENVLLTSWVPQPTVLAHPNCVLFLTHGGMFSQNEAAHTGVPVVGIPFFADQRYNVRAYEHLGMGLKLEFATITEETVSKALTTVLNDKRYKENAVRISRIIRDQPVSPADTVVYWAEYVLRHQGAAHLRPASAQLRWYQLTMLDVVGTLLAVALVALFLIYKLNKGLLSFFFGKKGSNASISKKTN